MATETIVTFTIPGHWVTERKRSVNAGKFRRHIDTPDRADFKAKVALFARQAMRGVQPLEGPLRMEVTFSKPKPDSWPKGPTRGNPWPWAPWKKPDVDNLVKIVSDPLSGIVYADDAQICERTERKVWGEWGVEIRLEQVLGLSPGETGEGDQDD